MKTEVTASNSKCAIETEQFRLLYESGYINVPHSSETERGDSHSPSLLVVGGAVVLRNARGDLCTKRSFSDYLTTLTSYFSHSTWFVPDFTDMAPGVALTEIPNRTPQFPEIQTYKNGLLRWPLNAAKFLRLVSMHTHVLSFLPAACYVAPLIPIASRLSRRTVTYLGNDYRAYVQLMAHRGSLWRKLYTASYEMPLRNSDACLARGRLLKRYCLELNSNVIETAPIASNCFPPCSSSGRTNLPTGRLLYIGKLSRGKGIPELLRAFWLVRERLPFVTLEVVGDGEYMSAVRDCESTIPNAVTVRGWVDDPDELITVYQRSDVLIVPSTEPEGVPRVIDEAMRFGLAVVASRIGGTSHEFSDDEVAFFDPEHVESLVSQLLQVLTSRPTYLKYSTAGLDRARLWTEPNAAAKQHAALLLSRGKVSTQGVQAAKDSLVTM